MGWMGFEHRARFDELLILPWSVSEFQEVDKRRDASDSADTAINSRLGCNPKPPRKLSGNRVKRCHTPPPPHPSSKSNCHVRHHTDTMVLRGNHKSRP